MLTTDFTMLDIVLGHKSIDAEVMLRDPLKGVQTFVATVFLSLCTARRAHLLLASKSNFEQDYFCDSPRKVSVC